MNKSIVFLSSCVAIILANTPVNAGNLLSPSLITPSHTESVTFKKELLFEWKYKKPSDIKKYHLVISTSDRFAGYNYGKAQCDSKKTCAVFKLKTASKTLPATHPFLQEAGRYYWQVQAFGKNGEKSLFFGGSKNTSTGTEVVRKQVNINVFDVTERFIELDDIGVEPKQASNGSAFTFTAVLTDELPQDHQIKIDVGEGWQAMTGKVTTISFNRLLRLPNQSKIKHSLLLLRYLMPMIIFMPN